MKEKSKFITFLLSFVPGLSHFYLGYADRGIIYLLIAGVIFISSLGLCFLFGDDAPILIFIFSYPIIWLISLVDGFSIINRTRYMRDTPVEESALRLEEEKFMNKKVITLGLSIVPGAGHMYLGHQQRGLIFMAGFFFTIFFMGWLNLGVLMFLLPLIWFYSFFDAFHIVNGNEVKDIDLSNILPDLKHEYIGKGLIALGIIIALENMLFPILMRYIDYEIRNYIQTSIVSLIFIIGGVKILKIKNKEEIVDEEGEENED